MPLIGRGSSVHADRLEVAGIHAANLERYAKVKGPCGRSADFGYFFRAAWHYHSK